MGDIESLFAGVFSSCALIYLAPAALPEKSLWKTTRNAFMTALALACSFLLTNAVRMLSSALWGVEVTVLLCVLFAFIFARATVWAFMPEAETVFLTASTAVLVLAQPKSSGWSEAVMLAVGTAVGVILLITALSPAVQRIRQSDAPKCIKGLPSVLFILGLAALAFGGF